MSIAPKNVEICYHDDSIAVIIKENGISCGQNSVYERSILSCLDQRTGRIYYQSIYNLSKGVKGLMLYPSSLETYGKIAQHMIISSIETIPPVRLTYRCILCGFLGIEGSCRVITTDNECCKYFHITIISVSRCSSTEHISLVDIMPIFMISSTPLLSSLDKTTTTTIENTVDTTKFTKYTTSYIKTLRNTLRHMGHPIVGDANMVKRSKGLFACLNSIDIDANVIGSNPLHISFDMPAKFSKLISREQFFWDRNKERDAKLLKSWKYETVGSDVKDDSVDQNNEIDDSDKEKANKNENENEGDEKEEAKYNKLSESDQPIEYIIGKAVFCDLPFEVSPDVMIPRKSSEILVHTALNLYEQRCLSIQRVDSITSISSVCSTSSSFHVLDLGTGSGNLLLSLLYKIKTNQHHLSSSSLPMIPYGIGIDISSNALNMARRNSIQLHLDDISEFVEFDFMEVDTMVTKLNRIAIDEFSNGGLFDIILCNPPYSSTKEIYRLSSSRRNYEPSLALFSPTGPLGCYIHLAECFQKCFEKDVIDVEDRISLSPCLLREGGYILFEVGHNQSKEVIDIMSKVHHLTFIRKEKDYRDIDRCLVFQYKNTSSL